MYCILNIKYYSSGVQFEDALLAQVRTYVYFKQSLSYMFHDVLYVENFHWYFCNVASDFSLS